MNCTYKAFFIWHFKLNSVCLHVIIMSRMSSRVNLHSIVCQRTPCSKQASYRKFKWQQWDSNPQPLSSWTNTQKLKLKLVSLLNCWVFVYELSGCGFESRCCHLCSMLLSFRDETCFENSVRCLYTFKQNNNVWLLYLVLKSPSAEPNYVLVWFSVDIVAS